MKCTSCNAEMLSSGKVWTYGRYTVELFRCTSCSRTINVYFIDKKLSHIIELGRVSEKGKIKRARAIIKRKIKMYLRKNGEASEIEIAKDLGLSPAIVSVLLNELQEEHLIEKVE